jgi:hypothetical protein
MILTKAPDQVAVVADSARPSTPVVVTVVQVVLVPTVGEMTATAVAVVATGMVMPTATSAAMTTTTTDRVASASDSLHYTTLTISEQ